MPFTDAELAAAMRDQLVKSGVITKEQLGELLKDSTEVNVKKTLYEEQLANFATYWQALDARMTLKGGNLKNTTGKNVPGRDGGNPSETAYRALYNDAFNDVSTHIEDGDLSPVKAVSNHLRFVNRFGKHDDSAESCCIIS